MIEFIRVNHINICVPPERLEEAKEFYTNLLRLKLIDRPNHLFSSPGYWLDIGDIHLHIGVEPFLGRSSRHTAFSVVDIVKARKHLKAYGIEIQDEAEIPGWARFLFVDPFGNRMELLQIIG